MWGLNEMIGVKTLVRQWAYKCSVKKKKKSNGMPRKIQMLPWWLSGKESPCDADAMINSRPLVEGRGVDPWVRKILWRRKWQPTPVFLPRESHGQRSLGATVLGFTGESDTN